MSVALSFVLKVCFINVKPLFEVFGAQRFVIQKLIPPEDEWLLLEQHLIVLERNGLVLVKIEEVKYLLEVTGVEVDNLPSDGLPEHSDLVEHLVHIPHLDEATTTGYHAPPEQTFLCSSAIEDSIQIPTILLKAHVLVSIEINDSKQPSLAKKSSAPRSPNEVRNWS